jgi:ABC-type nitrate/sulfonate/bicarbonate transport system permease component
VVTILLLFGYTRRFAAQHSASEGFSLSRAVGFVVAMMIFVGILSGVYSAIMANFFIKEELLRTVDEVMAQMQDVLPAESFDSSYKLMRASVTNPLFLTLSSVVSNCFLGVLVGICVGALVRRRPDIFADTNNGQPTE